MKGATCNVIAALLRKKRVIVMKNRRSCVCGLLVPTLLTLTVCLLFKIILPPPTSSQALGSMVFPKQDVLYVPASPTNEELDRNAQSVLRNGTAGSSLGALHAFPNVSSMQYFVGNHAGQYETAVAFRGLSPQSTSSIVGSGSNAAYINVTLFYNSTSFDRELPSTLAYVVLGYLRFWMSPMWEIPMKSLILPAFNSADFAFQFYGPTFLSFGMIFFASTLVILIVLEKEKSLKLQLTLSSLPLKLYWFAEFLSDFLFAVVAELGVIILGAIFQIPPFKSNITPLLHFFFFILFPAALVLFVYLLSFLFEKAEFAQRFFPLVMSITLFLPFFLIRFLATSNLSDPPSVTPSVIMSILPTYALAYYFQNLSFLTASKKIITPSNIFSEPSLGLPLLVLLLDVIVFASLIAIIEYVRFVHLRRSSIGQDIPPRNEYEDDDVAAERSRILDPSQRDVLRIVDISKRFGNKIAVNHVSLGIQDGECFGLLGVNGAGKTTLLGILTGVHGPSAGSATVDGLSIFSYDSHVLSNIGICPQFDRLWDELSPYEHLRLYGVLRGLKQPYLDQKIDEYINVFDLTRYRNQPSVELSGGNKRKLSVALSFIGDSRVVLLDEPSSGMDPVTRRKLWNMILQMKSNRCIVLVTHFMEEADALCSRIAIMVNGSIRCLGPSQHLKNKFGTGYRLAVRAADHNVDAVRNWIEREAFPGAVLQNAVGSSFIYELPLFNVPLGELFRLLLEARDQIGILDYSLSQTTLEQVFLRLASEQMT